MNFWKDIVRTIEMVPHNLDRVLLLEHFDQYPYGSKKGEEIFLGNGHSPPMILALYFTEHSLTNSASSSKMTRM
jgi:hypothetical protein